MAVPVSKTYAEWELSTFVLAVGQIGYDSTNNEHRIGNGIDTFFNLNKSQLNPDNFIFVKSKSDLPTPVGGVINLVDNATYFFLTTVDLLGSSLLCGQNTTILGASSENCRIKSTGLYPLTALINSEWSLPIRNITIEHNVAIDLDATGNANQALDWFGVNFSDCETVGTIKGYNNFIATDCALLNSGTLTFDGTIGTVGFQSCIFDAAATFNSNYYKAF
jgi:hypothetical protein